MLKNSIKEWLASHHNDYLLFLEGFLYLLARLYLYYSIQLLSYAAITDNDSVRIEHERLGLHAALKYQQSQLMAYYPLRYNR